jgi:hypothetical protein
VGNALPDTDTLNLLGVAVHRRQIPQPWKNCTGNPGTIYTI